MFTFCCIFNSNFLFYISAQNDWKNGLLVFSGVSAAVVKTPPSSLWILAILTPLFLLMVVIGMVAFIFCQKNRVIFKTGAFRTFRTRAKVGGLSPLHSFISGSG